MQKLILVLILPLFFLTAVSQIKKNTILLGGQINAYNYTQTYDFTNIQKNNFAQIGISLGKAFKENKVAGFSLSFGSQYIKNFNV